MNARIAIESDCPECGTPRIWLPEWQGVSCIACDRKELEAYRNNADGSEGADIVLRVIVEQEWRSATASSEKYFASYSTGDGREAGSCGYAESAIGALGELIAVLIRQAEAKAQEAR